MTDISGLGESGAALVKKITDDLAARDRVLDPREHELLVQAATTADQIAACDLAVAREGVTVEGSRGQTRIHPAVQEARQLRLVLLRLLGALDLPADEEEQDATATLRSRQARAAARARWDRRAEIAARRAG
jgi:hypothetical protein